MVKGLALSDDDVLRRDVIMALMCRGRVDFDAVEAAHGIAFADYFAPERAALAPMAEQGLVRLSPRAIEVTEAGWFLVRAVAMVFDRYCAATRTRFSRVV
ncbi:Oxygen-independent coproporphyrinogen-III oxidase [compost metagenome]